MAVYSFDQLKKLWTDNGGDPTYAAMAAAISLAESGGNSGAVSRLNSNGTHDYGLWQISLKGDGTGMLDPNANAKRAVAMSQNGVNWKPWCTAYSDGACGSKGGKYLGASSPFWTHLTGTGAVAPDPNGVVSGLLGNKDTGTGGVKTTDVSAKNDCLLSSPSFFGLGGGCILSTSQGRAIGGTLLIAAGAGVFLLGVVLISGKGSMIGQAAMTAVAPEAEAANVATKAVSSSGGKEPSYRATGNHGAKEDRKKPSDTGVHTVNKEKKLGRVIDAKEANDQPLSRSEYLRQQREKHPGSTHVTASGETF